MSGSSALSSRCNFVRYSLLEVTVSYGVDNTSSHECLWRRCSELCCSLSKSVASRPLRRSAGSHARDQVVLPLQCCSSCVVGWVLSSNAVAELRQGTGGLRAFGPTWLWMSERSLSSAYS